MWDALALHGFVKRMVKFASALALWGFVGLAAVAAAPVAAATGPVPLPDGRGYEMVTPAENEDADVYSPQAGPGNEEDGFATNRIFQAAADGDAVTYQTAPTSGGTGFSGAGGGNQNLAVRSPAGGWTQVNIQPPGVEDAFEAFSEDLSAGVLLGKRNRAGVGLTADAPKGNTLYRWASDGSYQALYTATQTHEQRVVSYGVPNRDFITGAGYAGATPDFSHILFEAFNALTPDALETGEASNNLYDWTGGELHLVNVLPDGTPQPDATFGAPPEEHSESPEEGPDFDHDISADGSRIVWTALNSEREPAALYLREGDALTTQLDAPEGGSGAAGSGRFWTASPDGSKIFFTDCNRLTADATAVASGGCEYPTGGALALTGNDLYEYDTDKPAGQRLTDLTVDHNPGDPLGADVQGVIATNETGEAGAVVYFAAGGALAPGATPRECNGASPETTEEKQETAEESQGLLPAHKGCNLYVLEKGKPVRLVATLLARDGQSLSPFTQSGGGSNLHGDWRPTLGDRTAEITPDGQSLVFMSMASLTGYPNGGLTEVYVYTAATNRLVCISCAADGTPPSLPGYFGAAAYVPIASGTTHQTRWISSDGTRVFFDSMEPLVAQDTNGRQDVYEWEREGAGGCPSGGAGGCLYLLSGGASTTAAWLIDVSASGDDAFFTTRAELVPSDKNENYDLYDARVGATTPPVTATCAGAGCQGVPAAPPVFATPASATFEGIGNFAPQVKPHTSTSLTSAQRRRAARATKPARGPSACRRLRVSRRRACAKRARRRHTIENRKSARGRG